MNFQRKIGSQDAFTQKAMLMGFPDGIFKYANEVFEFSADIDVAGVYSQGVAGNDESFEEQVRQMVH